MFKDFRTTRKRQGKRIAFTLAEVLITLAVIGIVAALTIPSFVNNTMQKEYSVALRKRYAELTQVARLSVIENGDMSAWDWNLDYNAFIAKYIKPYIKLSTCENCWTTAKLPQGIWFEQAAMAAGGFTYSFTDDAEQLNCYTTGEGDYCTELIYACQNGSNGSYNGEHPLGDSMSISFNQDLCTSYLNGGSDAVTPADEPEITYALPDGSQMGLYKQNNKSVLFIYLDVNGKKSPNKFGADKYLMMMSGGVIGFWGEGESDLTTGEYGCSSEGNGFYCGALLKANDWKFDKNYPKL